MFFVQIILITSRADRNSLHESFNSIQKQLESIYKISRNKSDDDLIGLKVRPKLSEFVIQTDMNSRKKTTARNEKQIFFNALK